MGLHECGLPEDKLPQCWYDDVRMNALFAPFRLKTANPESWDMKMKFWSDMIRQWCRAKGDAVVSAADAKVAFHRRGRTPACIDIVVEEMYRNGELLPISKYQQILHSGPEGWVSWGARLAFKPAAIAITAVSALIPGKQALDNDGLPKASIESTQRFVLESALKEQATTLLNYYPLSTERVGTIDELMRRSAWTGAREGFEVALGWLVANGGAVVKGDIVKLAEPSKKVSEITATDEALVRLVAAEARLANDEARLTREVDNARADAQAQYSVGNKPAAKNHLRRRHRADARLKKCEAALENVRQMLNALRDSENNRAIVHTYKTTSDALRENNLNEDTVLDTMDDLRDVMESYNAVERALSCTTDDVDAAELEAELNELLATPSPKGGDGKKGRDVTNPTPTKTTRKISERDDFVFDGEERILAELNRLGVDEASPPRRGDNNNRVPAAVPAAGWDGEIAEKPPSKPPRSAPAAKPWSPPSSDHVRSPLWDNTELRQDERLHPGQPLNIDYTTPPRLYSTDFQVRDHKLDSRVWLYNPRDTTSEEYDNLASGTEYFSAESPGKSGGTFEMAPGGEREKSLGPKVQPWRDDDDAVVADIERRLNNLRKL